MKLKHAALISTGLVITAGLVMIMPLFFQPYKSSPPQQVMLCFDISEGAEIQQWGTDIASVINQYDVPATVFVSGVVAEHYPQFLSSFNGRVDIGSRTYDYLDLTSIEDYSVKLQQVREGKEAVDDAGNLSSKIFRAPFGATDQDIYSLLSRSGILADFSYRDQYNVFENGQFIKYDASTYQARGYTADFFLSLPKAAKPLIIYFDAGDPVSEIEGLVLRLKQSDVKLVNASELTGIALTTRSSEIVN